jgi:hypothetical protein
MTVPRPYRFRWPASFAGDHARSAPDEPRGRQKSVRRRLLPPERSGSAGALPLVPNVSARRGSFSPEGSRLAVTRLGGQA